MKKILFTIFCLISFPVIGKAANEIMYCTSAEEAETRSLASNVIIDYEINIVDDVPIFAITVTNLTKDMVLMDLTSNKSYQGFNDNGSEISIATKNSGTYSFAIYSYKCKTKVAEKSLSLPAYNAYYKDPLCSGLESYSICQRWSGYSGTREKFENDIKEIKDSLEKEQTDEEIKPKHDKTLYEQIVDLFIHFWWILVIFIVLIIFIFYMIRKRHKKEEYDFKL